MVGETDAGWMPAYGPEADKADCETDDGSWMFEDGPEVQEADCKTDGCLGAWISF